MTVVTQLLMQPSGKTPRNLKTVRGVTYTAALGTPVAMPPYDASIAQANGWVRCGDAYGTTAARPTVGLFRGFVYNDSTLAYSVVWDGLVWRNPLTGASV